MVDLGKLSRAQWGKLLILRVFRHLPVHNPIIIAGSTVRPAALQTLSAGARRAALFTGKIRLR
jgi:hypothetical protein